MKKERENEIICENLDNYENPHNAITLTGVGLVRYDSINDNSIFPLPCLTPSFSPVLKFHIYVFFFLTP